MTIGGSIALIVIGAILRFAINWSTTYVDLRLVGVILMIAGAAGLIISLTFLTMRRRRPTSGTRTEVYEQRRYTEPPSGYTEPPGRYNEPPSGYTEPPGRYNDPPRGYTEPPGRYNDPPV